MKKGSWSPFIRKKLGSSRILRKLYKLIRVSARFVSGLFFDHSTWANPSQPRYILMTARTIRYKCAALGIGLTKNEKELIKLHNLHMNDRVFILGNGPSLNKCDLTLLKREYTFGVNSIFLNYDRMGFAPTYYVVEDRLVAEDRAESINAYTGPKLKFFGNYLQNYGLSDSPTTLWINVCVDYSSYKDFPHFSKNALRKVWVGGTVSYICLQLAFYMGFTEVYLIGFDHNYVIPKDVLLGKNKEITSLSNDPNHFHPDYFGKGYRWHDPQVARMEIALQKAKQSFEENNRKIYNATIGGKLEVFERVNYESLLADKTTAYGSECREKVLP